MVWLHNGILWVREVSPSLSFANAHYSASWPAHRGPSKHQEPSVEAQTAFPQSHILWSQCLADPAVLHDCGLQTGLFFLLSANKVAAPGPKSFSQNDLPNEHLERPNTLQLEGVCHLLHTPCSSLLQNLSAFLLSRMTYTPLIHLPFWKMKVRPWFTVAGPPYCTIPTDYWAWWQPCPSCFMTGTIPILAGELGVEF